jgi:glutamate synthase (NADPH/NADH) small chain
MNLDKHKTKMPTIDPSIRIKNFEEVSLGYDSKDAILEAERCLDCKHKPCVAACPVGIDIPGFIRQIKASKFGSAYQTILKDSVLPAVCGRVCPQEVQCESVCVRGIKGESVAIGRLERFAADHHYLQDVDSDQIKRKTNHIKVAIAGSGPAGLSCASQLLNLGYEVTIFESLHTPGGVLVYGIPEFRLPKEIVKKEIDQLIQQGASIKTSMIIGKTLYISDLFDDGYEAVFLGTGAGLPKFLNIEGEELNGVYSANEFLTRINLMKAYDQTQATPIYKGEIVGVVGGGNVAIDAARSAIRLGAKEVHIIYRRSMEELPARSEEIEHAIEEGVIFNILTHPIKVIGNDKGFVEKVECIKMKLGDVDASGRRRPIPIDNSNFDLNIDVLVVAVGTTPNPLISQTTENLEVNKWGCLIVNEDTGLTTKDYVYAGGDAVTGSATVILAMGAGKKAANAIDEKLKNKHHII